MVLKTGQNVLSLKIFVYLLSGFGMVPPTLPLAVNWLISDPTQYLVYHTSFSQVIFTFWKMVFGSDLEEGQRKLLLNNIKHYFLINKRKEKNFLMNESCEQWKILHFYSCFTNTRICTFPYFFFFAKIRWRHKVLLWVEKHCMKFLEGNVIAYLFSVFWQVRVHGTISVGSRTLVTRTLVTGDTCDTLFVTGDICDTGHLWHSFCDWDKIVFSSNLSKIFPLF